NEWNLKEGRYKFGVNDIIFENETYKITLGTRYEEENSIFGIENWFQQRINENWKYRVGFYYDIEKNDIISQNYEIWRKIHCLTLDIRISKSEEDFSFYFLLMPSIFFEKENWKERLLRWK
ncbi:hypothetical protein J7L87_02650, partial [bacterium]|nr:hypothetical protein [bacterium]